MKAAPTILLTAVFVAMSVPGLAADTPKQRYRDDMTCSAIITAAIDENALPASITLEKARSLQSVYTQQAQSSGHDAGIQPGKVASDIADMRQTIVDRMNASDHSEAKRETADTTSMTANCITLKGFELVRGMSGGPN